MMGLHTIIKLPQKKSTIAFTKGRRKRFDVQKNEGVKRLLFHIQITRKVNCVAQEHGEKLDNLLHDDLLCIMKEKNDDIQKAHPKESFSRIFWEQQFSAATSKDSCQVRWHPLMIRWCLNLKLLSSAAYHAMRTAGFIKLPSERTLCDYIHYFRSKTGFQQEVNEQLYKESKVNELPEHQRFCGIVLDEMKVKESLVYDKFTGKVVGFTDLGNINDELLHLEEACQGDEKHPTIATHILVLMVRGVFFKLQFPYAHFATNGVTGDLLFPIVWEAIRQIVGLKVIFITADGASPNRKFFRMHKGSSDKFPIYKTVNRYSGLEKRPLYFFSDPSHLIKTARNCWSHSDWNGTRLMTVGDVI